MFLGEGRWAQQLTHIYKVWRPASLLVNSQRCGRCWGSRVEGLHRPTLQLLGSDSSAIFPS